MPEFIKEYVGEEEGAIMGMLLAPLQGSSHKMAATPRSDSTAQTNLPSTPSLPLHFRDLTTFRDEGTFKFLILNEYRMSYLR